MTNTQVPATMEASKPCRSCKKCDITFLRPPAILAGIFTGAKDSDSRRAPPPRAPPSKTTGFNLPFFLEPRFIVLDEPTSMLDVISQAQVIEILRKIRREKGVSYLFITHNESLCRAFVDQTYRIRDGIVRNA